MSLFGRQLQNMKCHRGCLIFRGKCDCVLGFYIFDHKFEELLQKGDKIIRIKYHAKHMKGNVLQHFKVIEFTVWPLAILYAKHIVPLLPNVDSNSQPMIANRTKSYEGKGETTALTKRRNTQIRKRAVHNTHCTYKKCANIDKSKTKYFVDLFLFFQCKDGYKRGFSCRYYGNFLFFLKATNFFWRS